MTYLYVCANFRVEVECGDCSCLCLRNEEVLQIPALTYFTEEEGELFDHFSSLTLATFFDLIKHSEYSFLLMPARHREGTVFKFAHLC